MHRFNSEGYFTAKQKQAQKAFLIGNISFHLFISSSEAFAICHCSVLHCSGLLFPLSMSLSVIFPVFSSRLGVYYCPSILLYSWLFLSSFSRSLGGRIPSASFMFSLMSPIVSENRGFLSLTKYEPKSFPSMTLLLSS